MAVLQWVPGAGLAWPCTPRVPDAPWAGGAEAASSHPRAGPWWGQSSAIVVSPPGMGPPHLAQSPNHHGTPICCGVHIQSRTPPHSVQGHHLAWALHLAPVPAAKGTRDPSCLFVPKALWHSGRAQRPSQVCPMGADPPLSHHSNPLPPPLPSCAHPGARLKCPIPPSSTPFTSSSFVPWGTPGHPVPALLPPSFSTLLPLPVPVEHQGWWPGGVCWQRPPPGRAPTRRAAKDAVWPRCQLPSAAGTCWQLLASPPAAGWAWKVPGCWVVLSGQQSGWGGPRLSSAAAGFCHLSEVGWALPPRWAEGSGTAQRPPCLKLVEAVR